MTNRIEYSRNEELMNLNLKLQTILDLSDDIKRTIDNRKTKNIDLADFKEEMVHHRDKNKGWLASFGPEIKPADERALKQLSLKVNNNFNWLNEHFEIRRLFSDHFNAIKDQYKEKNKKISSEFKDINLKIRIKINDFLKEIRESVIKGLVDNCILPTYTHFSGAPTSGSVLAFDMVKSKKLTDDIIDEINNEARRVGFQNEAWQWSDKGDQLRLCFFDHEDTPIISHAERALKTAIEILARVTFKFPLAQAEFRSHCRDDKSRYQQLRVVLNSFDRGFENLSSAFDELEKLISDKDWKYHNTIFVIGDEIFKNLNGSRMLYKSAFQKATSNNKEIRKAVYWSDTIGWETLKMRLIHPPNPNIMKRNLRKFERYMVPGYCLVQVKIDDAEESYEALVHDYSQKGVRLRIYDKGDSDYFIGKNLCGKKVIIECNNKINKEDKLCITCEACLSQEGKIIYVECEKLVYLGLEFNSQVRMKVLQNFIEKCSLRC